MELNAGNQTKSHKHIPEVTDIIEWVLWFGIYVAIISCSMPKRVADLISYQSIIIGASQIGCEGKWVTYDRRFRLKASASPKKEWSNIDIYRHAHIDIRLSTVATPSPVFLLSTPALSGEHIIGVHTGDVQCNYSDWISAWKSHLEGLPEVALVPPAATAISSPLIIKNWKQLLSDHPNRPLVDFFIDWITNGFWIGFKQQLEPLQSAKRNLSYALQHPDTVESYLTDEVSAGRVAGPFRRSLIPHAHVSHFGVISKNQQPNKWRLIVDLSHPTSGSINSSIPKELCSLKYITVDSAIYQIRQIGQGTLLAKIDIKSAFHLLPVHPADRHLLSMRWDQQIFIDTCLPFGLRSAPKLFNILADLLSWILEQ